MASLLYAFLLLACTWTGTWSINKDNPDFYTIKVLDLYEEPLYRGRCFVFNYWGDLCINLYKRLRNRTSSLDTYGHCIMAYSEPFCNGTSVTFSPTTPSHNNLTGVNFDDMMASFRQC